MAVYKRGEIWWVRFRHAGVEVRQSARTRKRAVAEDYERRLKEEAGRLARGGRPRHTFDEMMARFMEEHFPLLSPSSQRRYNASISMMEPVFSGKHLDEIDGPMIQRFIARRKRDGVMVPTKGGGHIRRDISPATVRRDLACGSSAFDLAIEWEWADNNPFKSIGKRTVPVSKPRRRYLSREEYDRLVAAAPAYLRPTIIFAVATGMRLEEQLSLVWTQVDLKRMECHLPRTKSDTPRVVPLTAEALAVLRAQPRHIREPWVFFHDDKRPDRGEEDPTVTRFGKLNRGLAGAAKRAGVKDLRWHDLRRTCGSWMLQSGVDMIRVSRWLGHASVAVTERSYAFLDTRSLHEAAQIRAQGERTAHSAGDTTD